MTIKVLSAIKSMGILSLLLLLIPSCTNDDLNSIDAGFIDNLNFITTEIISEVEFSSEPIDSVKSSVNGQFLLGVYEEENVGKIRGSFVSQLLLPSYIYKNDTEGESVTSTIDDVVLYIPYHATVLSIAIENEIEVYTYKLDSIFGIKSETDTNELFGAFNFEVHQLETFLNPLDPTDPSKTNVYYSKKDYTSEALLASESAFSPSASHTTTTINRPILGEDETIQLTSNAPRIAVHLDKEIFITEILEKLPLLGEDIPDDFRSQESFIRYFKGLYVKTTSTAAASMVTLPLTNAFVDMYYTNVITPTEEEGGEPVVEAKTMRFNLGGVKAVEYKPLGVNDGSYPREANKLYIQGTSGSQANIKLFGYDASEPTAISMELDTLRNGFNGVNYANDENGNPLWLINEANLFFYVDGNIKPNVDKLFLYKKVPEINSILPYNSQLLDYLTGSNFSIADGDLLEEADENNTKSYYYKFKLTDYITELLKSTNTNNVDNLGLKIYTPGDYPNSLSDTLVGMFSWDPRGVVLFGGASGDDTDPKRVKLKINYSYQNR
jgi:hypothetical protein